MGPSPVDQRLEDWNMVANSARRPESAPRPTPTPTTIPMGILATGAVVIAIVALISPRLGAPSPNDAPAGGVVVPSTAVSATPTVIASVPPATPTESPVAIASPTSKDVASAHALVERYETNLVNGAYATSWEILAAESRAAYTGLAAYSAERSAFLEWAGTAYVLSTEPPDRVAQLQTWLRATDGVTIDVSHAVLIEVDYPVYTQNRNNAGWELYLVAPGATGQIELWRVR